MNKWKILRKSNKVWHLYPPSTGLYLVEMFNSIQRVGKKYYYYNFVILLRGYFPTSMGKCFWQNKGCLRILAAQTI
jgi:hypothetical protein